MNRVVVRQAATGLTRHLGSAPTVVIGFDGRRNSAEFAADTAAIVAGGGGRALLFPHVVPTPVLAFAVRHLDADAGVMVTASHNPPDDNGYKVYLADGAQVVSPVDTRIEAEIRAVGLPSADLPAPAAGGRVETVDDDVIDRYVDAIVAELPPMTGEAPVVAYTALHGVALDVLDAAFTAAGLSSPHVVAEQARPDGRFPTVDFPNPEEPGALDLVLALADDVGADVILANDPDGDRLALAVPGDSGWRVLSGDELGALLADRRMATTDGPDRMVATTIVSSRLLGHMAAARGVGFAQTLTGFKWIARAADADPRSSSPVRLRGGPRLRGERHRPRQGRHLGRAVCRGGRRPPPLGRVERRRAARRAGPGPRPASDRSDHRAARR